MNLQVACKRSLCLYFCVGHQYCAIQLKLRKAHMVTFQEEAGLATVFLSSNMQILHSVKMLALSLSSLFYAVLYIVDTEFTVFLQYLKSTNVINCTAKHTTVKNTKPAPYRYVINLNQLFSFPNISFSFMQEIYLLWNSKVL